MVGWEQRGPTALDIKFRGRSVRAQQIIDMLTAEWDLGNVEWQFN